MEKKTCAILARQSSTDGEESLSIDTQIDACRALATERGLKAVIEERELDTSGRWYPAGFEGLAALDQAYKAWTAETRKPAKTRPGLGKILASLDGLGYIVVYDATRLMRPLDGSFVGPLVIQRLAGAGVKVLSVKEGEIDFSRFADRLVNGLSGSVNSEQIRLSKEKSMASVRRLKDGGWLANGGCRLLGFRYEGKFKLVESEFAPAVREIILQAAAGVPFNRICRNINAKYPPQGRRWYVSSIHNICRNPVYAGLVKNADGEFVESKQTKGLVPYPVWKKAFDRSRAWKKQAPKPRKNPLTLSGMLYDGLTGEKLIGSVSKGTPFWVARSRALAGKKTARPVRWESKKPGVIWLKEALRPFVWPWFVEEYRAWAAAQADPEATEKMQVELDGLKAREAAIVDLIADGTLSKDAAKEKLEALKKRRAELEAARLATSKGPTRAQMFDQWNFIQSILHGRAPDEAYAACLREAVEKITVWDDRILVEGKWGSVELPRLIRKNHATFPRPRLDAELSAEHVPGTHDPLGMKLVVKYTYGPGGERVLFDGPNFKVVKKG